MVLHFLLLLLIPLTVTTTAAADLPPAYTATDLILLNCGGSSNSTDKSNRTWEGDDPPSLYVPWNTAEISSTTKASSMHPSVPSPVPYETARVFRSHFNYNFRVSPGQIFLRLYFYPGAINSNASLASFDVSANAFVLLKNFSAFLYSEVASSPSFIKEFVINIGENRKLDLTFSPNQNSFAFINGIEIVSIPDKLYFKGNDVSIPFLDQLFYLESNTALECLYRLNVGGGRVEIQNDSGPNRGMFRAWERDNFTGDSSWTPYMLNVSIKYTKETPPYTAPEIVYQTSRVIANHSTRLDWSFLVDSGFNYLLRFHFCEIQLEVTAQNQRVFTISINNQTADAEVDVISLTGGRGIPVFRDYITFLPDDDDGRRGKKDLWVSLFPNTHTNPRFFNALLNGLEIFKLNDTIGSLAAANPDPIPISPRQTEKKFGKNRTGDSSLIYAVIGSVVGALAVLAVMTLFIFRRRRRKMKDSGSTNKSSWVALSIASRTSTTKTTQSGVSLPSDLCRSFSLDEIRAATKNFDDAFIVGKGGFGNVYKGLIDNASTTVAIKRLNPLSKQGAHEFITEIEMLSKLRHLHLVSLIGYCDDSGEMILVYDYMPHGTLRDHLYNSEHSPLTWKQRLRICIGAAKGLHYLHTGAKNAIIHRDVKSTNILLDEKFVAKMSDFGLSKVGPTSEKTHVSTAVKGSIGYVDPEYYKRQQLTDKSDVYSFGVVLFEVLCARPPIIPTLPREQVNLAEWGKICFRKGKIEEIVDSSLNGQIAPESLTEFAKTAVGCLRDKGIDRPAMSDVVWSLQFAMQLQETAEGRDDDVAECGDVADEERFVAFSQCRWQSGIGEPGTTEEEMFSISSEAAGSKNSGFSVSSSEKLKSGDVFSEIMNPEGR